MRKSVRFSALLSTVALVSTSLALTTSAVAVESPTEDAVEVTTEEVVADDDSSVLQQTEMEEEELPPVEEAPVEEDPVTTPQPMEVSTHPTIAEVRAIDFDPEAPINQRPMVTTEGYVTASYPVGGLNGFVIQTAGDYGACDLEGESDAIFVFLGPGGAASAPTIGSYVEVTGRLAVFNGLLQISNTPTVTVVTEGDGTQALDPVTCAWPATDAEREAIESMLYMPDVNGDYVVTNNFPANRFGSLGISTSGAPLPTATDVARHGSDAWATQLEFNAAHVFTLDDGSSWRFSGGAHRDMWPPYVFADGAASSGATVEFVEPLIVDFRNGDWTLNTVEQIPVFSDKAPEALPVTFDYERPPAVTPDSLGEVTVGAFNIQNYYPNFNGEDWPGGCTYSTWNPIPITVQRCEGISEGDLSTGGPRGAWDDFALAMQERKLVNTLNELDASVVGLPEMENSYSLSLGKMEQSAGVAILVDALNEDAGYDKWDYVETNTDQMEPLNQQDVMYPAIIFQPAEVELVGPNYNLYDQSAPGEPFSNARAPFGQAFKPVGGGEPFFFTANHFKSKSGPGDGDEADLGQGGWNASRIRQATAIDEWISDVVLPDLSANYEEVTDSVIVGDLNAYSNEDPMWVLYDAGYQNLNLDAESVPLNATYSFSGRVGSLDYVLVKSEDPDRTTGLNIWNNNHPEQAGLHYEAFDQTPGNFIQDNLDNAYRSSDHDAVIAGLKAGETQPSGPVELNLININDFHGRIDGTLSGNDPESLTSSFTVNFAYTIEKLRGEHGADNTLFLSAGDNWGASLFASALQSERPTIEVLNALDLEATTVGNHEFSTNAAGLMEQQLADLDATVLAANVKDANGNIPLGMKAYVMLKAAGLNVAVVGAITDETPSLTSPANVAGLTFEDPVDTVNAVVKELTTKGDANGVIPDVIIAEYHDGGPLDQGVDGVLEDSMDASDTFARIITDTSPDVAAIFTGHTHRIYAFDAPIPGTEGKTRPVVQAGGFGQQIGNVVLTVDPEAKTVESYTADIVPVPTASTDQSPSIEEMTDNPVVQDVYDITLDAVEQEQKEGGKVASYISAPITTAFQGGSFVNGVFQGGSRDDRSEASSLATLVSDSMMYSLGELPDAPDFAVINPGGLRADLYPGEDGAITVAQARSVLPFNSNLAVVTLTGEQVVQMLEQQWQRDEDGNVPSRDYLQLGFSENVSYTYREVTDPQHPTHVKGVIGSVLINGVPLDPEGTYRVGTVTFLANGGDNFTVFRDGDVMDTGMVDWEGWLAFLASNGTKDHPITPNFARAGVEVEGLQGGDEMAVGSTQSVTVSRVNVFSQGAPENTEISASFGGGDAFVTAPVTNDTATLNFTVPKVAAGEALFSAITVPNGTSADIPVKVTTDQPTELDVRRLFGSTRFGTNVAVNDAVPAKGGVVFVASGAGFADALSAAPAAAAVDGSLFLTPKDRMPASTLEAIVKLDPSKVYIIGGSGAVSTTVATQLRGATQVLPIRLGGANRYDTNAKVLTAFFNHSGVESAFVATGTNFPDAISAAAAGGALEAPVVLARGASATQILPEAQRVLTRSGVDTILIAGGTGAVGSTLETNLGKSFDTVIRLSGSTRYSTNLAVNDYVTSQVGDAALTDVWVATGVNFPDALSAAVPAGKLTDRLVLSNGKCIPSPVVSSWIKGPDSQVNQVTLVGGTGALSQAVEKLTQCG